MLEKWRPEMKQRASNDQICDRNSQVEVENDWISVATHGRGSGSEGRQIHSAEARSKGVYCGGRYLTTTAVTGKNNTKGGDNDEPTPKLRRHHDLSTHPDNR
jgi:hypothetical protein